MNKNVIKRLLKYLNKNIVSLSITLILAVVSVVLTIYVPILFGNAIDLIIDKGNVDFDGLKAILFKIFIIILVILGMWFLTIGYLVYVLNDIGTIETTQEVQQENENGNNNFIGNDGDINNG